MGPYSWKGTLERGSPLLRFIPSAGGETVQAMLHPTLLPIGKQKKEVLQTPSSNTGCLGKEIGVRSDWIGFCVRQEKLSQNIQKLAVAIFWNWAKHGVFGGEKGWRLEGATSDDFQAGFNGFHQGAYLKFGDEVRGSIQWGGTAQNGWVQFELRGALLALLPRREQLAIYRFACRAQVRLNRVDIACDDFQGKYFCPRQAYKDWEIDPCRFLPGHRYDKGSRAPVRDRQGTPENGETTYIGSQQSSIRLRIYDKSLQLKAMNRQSVEALRHPSWVRWETEFKRRNGVTLDYLLLHPDYQLAFCLGASQKLADIFGRSGLRGVWLIPKAKQEVIEQAARAGLSLRKQRGVSNYYLIQVFGLQGFLDRYARPDKDSPLASLSPGDADAIDAMAWELEHAADDAPSSHQDTFKKLAAGFGIVDSPPQGGLRSSVPGGESSEEYAALF